MLKVCTGGRAMPIQSNWWGVPKRKKGDDMGDNISVHKGWDISTLKAGCVRTYSADPDAALEIRTSKAGTVTFWPEGGGQITYHVDAKVDRVISGQGGWMEFTPDEEPKPEARGGVHSCPYVSAILGCQEISCLGCVYYPKEPEKPKGWRPDGWDNPHKIPRSRVYDWCCTGKDINEIYRAESTLVEKHTAYEAGADAILKALWHSGADAALHALGFYGPPD